MPQPDPLKLAKDALDKAIETEKRNRSLLASIGPAIIEIFTPVLDNLTSIFQQSHIELREEISKIKIQIPEIKVPEAQVRVEIPEIKIPEIRVPEIKIPEIKIPEIKIPPIKVPKPEVTVNPPSINIPKLEWPNDEMPIRGWVSLMGVDLNNPLPVQLRDAKGNPVNLFENITSISSGGGGARIGRVSVNQLDITVVGDGRQTTTAGSRVQLSTTSIPCKKVTITALPNNTDLVVIGSNTVVASSDTRRGHPLFTGSSITFDIDNINKVFIDVVTTGEGVTYLYTN